MAIEEADKRKIEGEVSKPRARDIPFFLLWLFSSIYMPSPRRSLSPPQVHRLITARDNKFTNFVEFRTYKVIYRRYAGLFFSFCVDTVSGCAARAAAAACADGALGQRCARTARSQCALAGRCSRMRSWHSLPPHSFFLFRSPRLLPGR